MKRTVVMVAVVLAMLTLDGSTKTEAANPPASNCSIKSVVLQGTTFKVVKPSCKRAGKNVAFTTKWTRQFGDLLATPTTGYPRFADCRVRPAAGNGSTTSLIPATIGRMSGSLVPGFTKVTFTITAAGSGKKISASRSWTKVNPATRVYCGPPAPLSVAAGDGPPVCTWATKPKVGGLVVIAGTVKCIGGDGSCRWTNHGMLKDGNYLHPYYIIRCTAGPNVYLSAIRYEVFFKPADGDSECSRVWGFWSGTFNVYPLWGAGTVRMVLGVYNAHLENRYPEGSFQSSPLVAAKGAVDPCNTGELPVRG